MKLKNLLMVLAILTLLVGSTGCIFSPEKNEDPPPEPDVKDPNINPDVLMENFEIIYEAMDFDGFEDILHQDYRTVLLQSTFDVWEQSDTPLAELFFDHDTEVQIHQNIFSGIGGVNEFGVAIPPIDSISVSVLDKEGAWILVEDSEEYFGGRGAYFARYNLLLHFNKPNGDRFEVDQTVDFFVIQGSDELWYMLGQRGMNN